MSNLKNAVALDNILLKLYIMQPTESLTAETEMIIIYKIIFFFNKTKFA